MRSQIQKVKMKQTSNILQSNQNLIRFWKISANIIRLFEIETPLLLNLLNFNQKYIFFSKRVKNNYY